MACCGCLAADLRLISLKDTHLDEEFLKIIEFSKFPMLDRITFLLCWLCHARLKRFVKFKNDCLRSVENLLNCVSKNITEAIDDQYFVEIRKNCKLPLLSVDTQTFSYDPSDDNYVSNDQRLCNQDYLEEKSECLSDKESERKIKTEFINDTFVECGTIQPIIELNEKVDLIKPKCKRKVFTNNVNSKVPIKRIFNTPAKNFDETLVIETILSREQQLKELEDLRNSEEFIKSPYKCEMCVKGFSHEIVYKEHCIKHESVCGPFVCDLCSQHFNTLRNLNNHLDTHTRRYTCRLCAKVVISKQNIMSHMYIEHDKINKEIKCILCNRVYKNRYTYAKHMRIHNSSKEHKCHLCPKVFLWKDNLNRHLTRHTDEKPFKCEKCPKKFYFKENLKDHQLVHTDNKKFYCVECDLSYASQVKLNQHLKRGSRHLQPDQLTFACKFCERRYTNSLQLTTHIDSVHLNKRSQVCQLCDAAFVNKKNLQVHIRNIHEGYKKPRKHICETCGKGFTETKVLRAHIRTHTGEKPYSCKFCSVKFAHSGARYTHIKLVHLKLKKGNSLSKKHLKSESSTTALD